MSRLEMAFNGLYKDLPGSSAVDAQRKDAFERFMRAGLPTRRDEDWRYTEISALGEIDFRHAVAPPATAKQAAHHDPLPIRAGSKLTFVNGRYAPESSTINQSHRMLVHPLETNWTKLSDGFPGHERVFAHPLGLVNTAFTQLGAVISIPKNSHVDTPILLEFLQLSDDTLAVQPRLIIELAANSSAEVIVQHAGQSSATNWTNMVTEIHQSAGSKLTFIHVQEQGLAATHTCLTTAALKRDAHFSGGYFDLGGKLARNDIEIALDEHGASAELFGAFLPIQSQHADNHIKIDHRAPNTTSNEYFRGIAGPKSRGVFNGKVIVHKHAQKISAQQRSDNLLLDKTAEIDTKPELEIYADDVKCSHGATVGELDEQHLFYLQSRGINELAARALLTFAFANSSLDFIKDEALRTALSEKIAKRLPQHEKWERLT